MLRAEHQRIESELQQVKAIADDATPVIVLENDDTRMVVDVAGRKPITHTDVLGEFRYDATSPLCSPAASGVRGHRGNRRRKRKHTIVIRDGKTIIDGEFHRTYLGISSVDMTNDLRDFFGAPKDSGVLVQSIAESGPAAKAGVRSAT